MDTAVTASETARWRGSPLVWATLCWIVGLVLGRAIEAGTWVWLGAAAVGAATAWAALIRMRRQEGALWPWRLTAAAAAVMVVCSGAGWWSVRVMDEAAMLAHVPGDADRGQLVQVEAVVTRSLSQRTAASGEMGQFDYRGPGTTAWVRVEHWSRGGDGFVSVGEAAEAGEVGGVNLLVSVPAFEDRLRVGDRVRLRGWLVPFRPPGNPGERDFRRAMRERGVVGRLAVGSRANVQVIETIEEQRSGWHTGLRRMLERSRGGAERALRHGLPVDLHEGEPFALDRRDRDDHDPRTAEAQRQAEVLGLLEALLLGKRGGDMEELEQVFERTGLTHLLAISGLHLGILVAGTWWLVLVTTGRPGWAVAVAIGVVAGYVLMVPARVPVLRAATMTLAAVAALGWGRRVSAMATMSGAALLLLIWRPWDLFTAGFQLSFAVVAALVLFARSTAQWMWPRRTLETWGTGKATIRRYGVDYFAVSIVAWCTAMPLVAWHFGQISPWAVLAAVAMLPFVMLLLWVGYLKVVVTALWPAVGAWMGYPLWWIGEATVAVVRGAARFPATTVEVGSVSGWWAISALAVAWAMLGGAFAGRRVALAAGIALLAGYLALAPAGGRWGEGGLAGGVEGVKVNMLSVGHGSAILIRSGDEAWLYDCGSADHLDITTAVVGPALDALGVRQLDALVITHPDLDHLSGVIELVDKFDVQRVLLTRQFLAEVEGSDWNAARFVIDAVRDRGVRIERIGAGWRQRLGEAEVNVPWPPADADRVAGNDASLMMRIESAGRRVLLTGDVQAEAMGQMLEGDVDVSADVVELPHHGAWVEIGPRWLEATGAQVVLQSTNERRLRHDRWAEHIADIERHLTPLHGMIEVYIDRDGRIHRRRFRDDGEGWHLRGGEPRPDDGRSER